MDELDEVNALAGFRIGYIIKKELKEIMIIPTSHKIPACCMDKSSRSVVRWIVMTIILKVIVGGFYELFDKATFIGKYKLRISITSTRQ